MFDPYQKASEIQVTIITRHIAGNRVRMIANLANLMLPPSFSSFQFVCMGGTPKRMENFAHFIMDEIGYKLPAGTQLQDISAFSYRYSMYKVRPSRQISITCSIF